MQMQMLSLLPALASAAHIGVVSPIALHREHRARSPGSLALAIPDDSVAGTVLMFGSMNFITACQVFYSVYVLMSIVPQAQSVALLRPIAVVGDAYFKFWRGIFPTYAYIDFSISACLSPRVHARLARRPPPPVRAPASAHSDDPFPAPPAHSGRLPRAL